MTTASQDREPCRGTRVRERGRPRYGSAPRLRSDALRTGAGRHPRREAIRCGTPVSAVPDLGRRTSAPRRRICSATSWPDGRASGIDACVSDPVARTIGVDRTSEREFRDAILPFCNPYRSREEGPKATDQRKPDRRRTWVPHSLVAHLDNAPDKLRQVLPSSGNEKSPPVLNRPCLPCHGRRFLEDRKRAPPPEARPDTAMTFVGRLSAAWKGGRWRNKLLIGAGWSSTENGCLAYRDRSRQEGINALS